MGDKCLRTLIWDHCGASFDPYKVGKVGRESLINPYFINEETKAQRS